MSKAKREKVSAAQLNVLEAWQELHEEFKETNTLVIEKEKEKENVLTLTSVVENLKYNDYEKGQVVEIPRPNDIDGLADNFRIESIGVEGGRYYAMLNRITVTGNVDKRYKSTKKFFDENVLNKVNVFSKGDSIFLNKRGAMAWEANDYTRPLKKNFYYTVRQMRYDKGLVYVELNETGTLLHPNHFGKREENDKM